MFRISKIPPRRRVAVIGTAAIALFCCAALAIAQDDLTLPPRIARRLRALAHDRGKPVERVASALLAAAVVPSARERRRLVVHDLANAGVEAPK